MNPASVTTCFLFELQQTMGTRIKGTREDVTVKLIIRENEG